MNALADAGTMRRGACPSLSAPMQTGDGLLVRLQPESGVLTPLQLQALAELAGRHGNGILEVTARGNLQIRGLSEASAAGLADGVAALAIEPRRGVPVEASPLAGLDPEEIADAGPVAEAIRRTVAAAGLAARLGPKVTVVVDGGGRIGLGELLADVRVRALPAPTGRWEVALGGTAANAQPAGTYAETEVAQAVGGILGAIASRGTGARGRDLVRETAEADAPRGGDARKQQVFTVGRIALANGSQALAVALPFGQLAGTDLARIASQAAESGIEAIRLAPQRRMLLLGAAPELDALERLAAGLGLVTQPDDHRLRVVACAGAPACRSGFIDTKALATDLAALSDDTGLHVSGCPKGCAEPTGMLPAVVGISEGEAETRVGGEVRRVEVGRGGAAVAILPALRELLASREGGESRAAAGADQPLEICIAPISPLPPSPRLPSTDTRRA